MKAKIPTFKEQILSRLVLYLIDKHEDTLKKALKKRQKHMACNPLRRIYP